MEDNKKPLLIVSQETADKLLKEKVLKEITESKIRGFDGNHIDYENHIDGEYIEIRFHKKPNKKTGFMLLEESKEYQNKAAKAELHKKTRERMANKMSERITQQDQLMQSGKLPDLIKHPIEFSRVTLVNHTSEDIINIYQGGNEAAYKFKVEAMLQDGGKTLKLFFTDKEIK